MPLLYQAAAWALLYLGLYALDWAWPSSGAALGFALTFTALSLLLIGLAYMGAGRARRRGAVLALSGLTLAAPLLPPSPWTTGLASGALLLLGLVGGAWVGRRIQSASHLWPVALVACAADAWSVASPQGPTNQMLNAPEGAWSLAALLLISLPSPGVGVSPILGVADALIISLLFGAAAALKLDARRLAVGVLVGLLLCLAALLITAQPLPALPFIALAGVAALGAQARPAIKEVIMALLFCAAFVGLAALSR